jgi:trimeric autotransporter adhesin
LQRNFNGARKDCCVGKLRRITGTLTVCASIVVLGNAAGAISGDAPRKTWGTNGQVNEIVRLGSRVYVGGDFTAARSPNGSLVTRRNLAAFDAASGDLVSGWNPGANGIVHSLDTDGSRIFVGGAFTTVSGVARARLAAVSTSGRLVSSWRANANAKVKAVDAVSGRLYVGGAFTSINGRSHRRLAAVSTETGSLVPWSGGTNDVVHALKVSGGMVYAGGDFTSPRRYAAAFSASGGAWNGAWDPFVGNIDPARCGNGCVLDVDADSKRVYLAVGGVGGNRAVATNSTTGNTVWQKIGDGDFHSIAVGGSRVYAGGHFISVGGDSTRKRFITVQASSGAYISDFNPFFDKTPWAITTTPDNWRLYVGGAFTRVSGVAQHKFALFD